ncbi:MAG: hypothetical protein A3F84_11280 [Candidatus Handelsmanbacteria bacterium RIFCSPLOWO2_12_FULL_64_10]|uniref:Pectic acid lyase n=1 Tax=Handelsmanbacteria sp. (strain RIFCSPLOWO2_12_FULL_64_10) TaxID=1817868 RepID=A0A1F6C6Y9_HANXR|nr:MAG: hypothetical protein A3F84_11280 [Candidatus Handelsmanbacteria bacterium RIFCSPLOWO2_12_FULL_64_10]
MQRATRFFRARVAVRGGYVWQYRSDLSAREGEEVASASTIWVQPPGTPAVGMACLEAWEATGDTLYLDVAREAARALAWGQLASGGWDYRIDFDPQESGRWYYRRDVEAGDAAQGDRRNTTTLDDNTTQGALRLLMRVDRATRFQDAEVRRAARYALRALIRAQYPNGAWPQRYSAFPDPEAFPVRRARYPEAWPRVWPKERYADRYTLNDNAIADMIATLIEAYRTYKDEGHLNAARRGGEFLILAQMPDPQPAWAQQYSRDMEPVWARRFEPPAVASAESFGAMRALMNLYLETGEGRFLEPVPRALAWARRSALPDGQLARFYELETNRPLYFTRAYELTYSDVDLPDHYAFKIAGARLMEAEGDYERIVKEGRDSLRAKPRQRPVPQREAVEAAVASIDGEGRWVEEGWLKDPDGRGERVRAEVISCQTFNRNLTLLARYVAATKP